MNDMLDDKWEQLAMNRGTDGRWKSEYDTKHRRRYRNSEKDVLL